jgi:hypothetical protein
MALTRVVINQVTSNLWHMTAKWCYYVVITLDQHICCIKKLQKITKSFKKSQQNIGPRVSMGREWTAAPLSLKTVGPPHSLAWERDSNRYYVLARSRATLCAAEVPLHGDSTCGPIFGAASKLVRFFMPFIKLILLSSNPAFANPLRW